MHQRRQNAMSVESFSLSVPSSPNLEKHLKVDDIVRREIYNSSSNGLPLCKNGDIYILYRLDETHIYRKSNKD